MVHRYVGLVLALFLTITGLTGAAIAWNDELERVFAPSLFVLPAGRSERPALDPFALRDAAARAHPRYAVNGIDFTRAPDEPARFYIEARPGGPDPTETQIALDPVDGRQIGARRQGDIGEGLINLMPFLYDLHDELALGETGSLILGVVALLWTVDCFIGAYLTFPVGTPKHRPPAKWLKRWNKAWVVRRASSGFKLIFDLHTSGGLWFWGMLLILAWSSVGFNLQSVYRPVTCSLLACAPDPATSPARVARPPKFDWRATYAIARREMAAGARREGFVVRSERLMFYDPTTHIYAYRVKSDRDPGKLGNTQLLIDGDNGHLVNVTLPTGRAAGDTLTTWLEDIHTADVFGRTMQVVLTITGLATAMLSITGVLIYIRKSTARRRRRKYRRMRRLAEQPRFSYRATPPASKP